MHTSARYLGGLLVGALALSGCLKQPDEVSMRGTERVLVADTIERHAREITVRVRNRTACGDLAVGSGVVIGPDLLVTNRHVVEGAAELQVDTWDGRSITVPVAGASPLADIAIIRTTQLLPTAVDVATTAPVGGDPVYAVGYPLGGALEFSDGKVIDYVDGSDFGEIGRVLRTDMHIEHGNSGGPLLDRDGRLAGVVFAKELATDYGLVIPLASIQLVASAGAFSAIPPC